jgi:hypothetical protein
VAAWAQFPNRLVLPRSARLVCDSAVCKYGWILLRVLVYTVHWVPAEPKGGRRCRR